jgi:hypothetical protein
VAEDVFGLQILGQSLAVGGASGVVGAAGNAYLGEPVTPQSVFFDTTIGAITYGAAEYTPAVPGRLPNFGTAAFFSGEHTQQNAIQLGVDAGANYLSSIFTSIFTPAKINSYTPSGAVQTFTTPSGAVVNANGQLISGPPQKK